MGFPGGSEGKASGCNAGDPGSIPGSGRSPGEGNGNSLQYSCLEYSMDRGAWRATVLGAAKTEVTQQNVHSTVKQGGEIEKMCPPQTSTVFTSGTSVALQKPPPSLP